MIEREAHYTQGKQPTVQFASTYNGRRLWGRIIKVTGKREARKLAIARNATPWNF
jgi:ribosomal protein L35AE/L33A